MATPYPSLNGVSSANIAASEYDTFRYQYQQMKNGWYGSADAMPSENLCRKMGFPLKYSSEHHNREMEAKLGALRAELAQQESERLKQRMADDYSKWAEHVQKWDKHTLDRMRGMI